jgi:DNA segregation ATPase FtsK/SpoIIIE, S-DNA-T family
MRERCKLTRSIVTTTYYVSINEVAQKGGKNNMIFEVLSTTIMGAISLKAYLSKSGAGNDSKKISKIFALSGLNVKDGSQILTAQQLKKKNIEGGIEYRYRIPLGRSFEDYVAKQKAIESGVNTRSVKIQFKDIRGLKLDRNIISNIKGLREKKLTKRKEIELLYDGVLKIRVYNEPLSDEVTWNETMLKHNSWAIPIGFNRNGVIYHDFDKSKHLIIAGVPGSGKSVVMKLITTCLLMIQPDHTTFSLIDLKGGPAFGRFKNVRQVKHLGVNNKEALSILKEVQADMERVYQEVLVPNDFEDVTEAGIKDRHFVIIDEAADLADDKEAVEVLTDIVRKGRGSGHYVIYATQYPTVQTVASQIKRNIPARLTYVLDSTIASNAVLDTSGAESLPEIPGRGIYKMVKQQVIQTPYMSNKLIQELIQPFIKKEERHEPPKRKTRTNSFITQETRLS